MSGRLTFIRLAGRDERYQKKAEYLCICGTRIVALIQNVKRGHTKSCGCLRLDINHDYSSVHSESSPRTAEYKTWLALRERCNNPKKQGYENYGGRGIKVCHRWATYQNFLSDMGRKPTAKHSIDRINPNGNYEPPNCRWTTIAEQNSNRRKACQII